MSDPYAARYLEFADSSDLVYVLDEQLRLIWHNDEWQTFAAANGGASYLQRKQLRPVVEQFVGPSRAAWEVIYRMLLDGAIERMVELFACPSPKVYRRYQLWVHVVTDDAGRPVRLIHRTKLLSTSEPGNTGIAHQRRETTYASSVGISRIRVASRARAVDEIGGDVFWARPNDKGGITCALIDAMGHGDAAAIVASFVTTFLDQANLSDPGDALARLNSAMLAVTPAIDDSAVYATGMMLSLDVNAGEVEFVPFGGYPPFSSAQGLLALPPGFPIGLVETKEPWGSVRMPFTKLGRLLVFTDGLPEQFDATGTSLHEAGLQHMFEESHRMTADRALDSIFAAVDHYRGSALICDDQTLCAIDLLGGPP